MLSKLLPVWDSSASIFCWVNVDLPNKQTGLCEQLFKVLPWICTAKCLTNTKTDKMWAQIWAADHICTNKRLDILDMSVVLSKIIIADNTLWPLPDFVRDVNEYKNMLNFLSLQYGGIWSSVGSSRSATCIQCLRAANAAVLTEHWLTLIWFSSETVHRSTKRSYLQSK